MSNTVVGFAGMTHLGLLSAVGAAEWGFEVVAYDGDPGRVADIARGQMPVNEPDLEDAADRNRARLTFTSARTDLQRCDVVYVAPDVPVTDDGQSDLSALSALFDEVAAAIRPDTVLVILSQVPPGFTASRARAGLQLYYQVETLIFGRALQRALEPERYIVGCADPAQPLPPALEAVLSHPGCPILRMRYESAELTKIAINLCLVASISVANTLAEVCETTGADWAEIAPALRLDRRIGQHAYLAAGLGLGGSNLIRDMATVVRLGDASGTDVGVLRAQLANSERRRAWAGHRLQALFGDRLATVRLALWGLAYKENTASTKNSPALATLAMLPSSTRIAAFDPAVEASAAFHPGLVAAPTPLAALEGAEALMILTPWPEFRAIAPADIAAALPGRVVIDPYAVVSDAAAAAAGIERHTLGRA